MAPSALHRSALVGLVALATASALPAQPNTQAAEGPGTPSAFRTLDEPREVLVDVYSGGKMIGEAVVTSRPGFLRFKNPLALAALLPVLTTPSSFQELLASELPSNAGLVCSDLNGGNCGRLEPEIVGVIYDEARFRVDLFIGRRLLPIQGQGQSAYLRASAGSGLTSAFGLAVSGSGGGGPTYNLQSRTLVSLGPARVRSDTSLASGQGVLVDHLAAEVDAQRWRYAGGLFWTPGLDLVGRRKILGVGVTTQFYTRRDREELEGTPLILFLAQPARIELFVDSRLVGSESYDAGNVALDTAGLPDGSYPVTIRVFEPGQPVREEQRFFAKQRALAPLGEPLYRAVAGIVTADGSSALGTSPSFYLQLGTSRRLGKGLGIDADVELQGEAALAHAGLFAAVGPTRVRVAGLAGSDRRYGAMLQLTSTIAGRLSANFDVRRIASEEHGARLIEPGETFGGPGRGNSAFVGDYLQASGTMSYSLGSANLRMTGFYRRQRGGEPAYSIGPSGNWTVVRRSRLHLAMVGDGQRSNLGTSAYLGVRLLVPMTGAALAGSFGTATLPGEARQQRARRLVGNLSGEWTRQGSDPSNLFSARAELDRSFEQTTLLAGSSLTGSYGNLRGEISRALGRKGAVSQYGLALQAAIAADRDQFVAGGHRLEESALLATVTSTVSGPFEILVDGVVRGVVKAGSTRPIFLAPYRSYSVRLRPLSGALSDYDGSERTIDLFPGNVVRLEWRVQPMYTVFGRLVGVNGSALAHTVIRSTRSTSQTDDQGFFQVEVGAEEPFWAEPEGGERCEFAPAGRTVTDGVISLGVLVCAKNKA